MKSQLIIQLILLVSLLFPESLFAQKPVLFTRPSQKATVIQRIGTTDIKVQYHSPLVKDRKIFGDIVPYNLTIQGKAHPWRAGANENTLISFTHDVKIEGQTLPAGSYGLHMIVNKNEWTIIFSKNDKAWGSFYYKEEEDALRINIEPEKGHFQEWLSYQFRDTEASETKLEMKWEKVKISFTISTDVNQNIISDVQNITDKKPEDYLLLAQMIYKNDSTQITKAIEWINKSIEKGKTFSNQMFKSLLLTKNGDLNEGKSIKEQLLKSAKANELFSYAMYLLNEKKFKDCLNVLKINEKRFPDAWQTYFGYGNYYKGLKKPEKDKVVKNLKRAWELAPENVKPFTRYRYFYEKSNLL